MNFQWFHEIHAVMRRRAIINPPGLLESSVVSQTGDEEAGSNISSQFQSRPITPASTLSDDPSMTEEQLSNLDTQLPDESQEILSASTPYPPQGIGSSTSTLQSSEAGPSNTSDTPSQVQ